MNCTCETLKNWSKLNLQENKNCRKNLLCKITKERNLKMAPVRDKNCG